MDGYPDQNEISQTVRLDQTHFVTHLLQPKLPSFYKYPLISQRKMFSLEYIFSFRSFYRNFVFPSNASMKAISSVVVFSDIAHVSI